ncbi:MAG TPA: hypothetical protein VN922_20930, partial [Bacteroidia bacterium]|nr:hypothetical protein [Bacteroidia bacterium]
NGASVIMGYINKNQKALTGEMRLFSTDAQGAEQMYVWLRNNGYLELGGDTNFAVKYNQLETEFNKLKTDHNNLLADFKALIHPGVTVGTGSTGAYVSTLTPNTSDITQVKNDKIKTIG